MTIVALDVDGVVADLHAEWLRRYNRDFQDTLVPEDVRHWDIGKFVSPRCGARIYDYLSQPGLYDGVWPVEGAQEGVEKLRSDGHRVVFATSCVQGMADQKWRWLQTHKFLPPGVRQTGELVIIHDKSLLRADVLIDDYHENLRRFSGMRILFDAPYNQQVDPPIPHHLRMLGWTGMAEIIPRALSSGIYEKETT